MSLETKCMKIQLKPGSLDRVRQWAREINSRRDEAVATLRDEGIIVESAFLGNSDQGDFLIYYIKAKSFEQADAAANSSNHPIDEFHQQFKRDTWLNRTELEMLVDLDRLQEVDEH